MAQQQLPTHIGQYIVDQVINQGRFGAVLLAHHEGCSERVVLKLVDTVDTDGARNARRETASLKSLQHQNTLKLLDSFTIELGSSRYLVLVLEYADRGDLFKLIVSRGRLSESVAKHIFRQLVSALAHTHSHQWVHRDLKPENILLDKYLNVKLADFGLATRYDPLGFVLLSEFCGSFEYASPEILQHSAYFGPEVDIYSLGVVLYAMLCGRRPFCGRTSSEMVSRIYEGAFPVPSYLSTEAVSLLRHMLAFDSLDRASLQDILSHPWMAQQSEEVVSASPLQLRVPVARRCRPLSIAMTPEKMQTSVC